MTATVSPARAPALGSKACELIGVLIGLHIVAPTTRAISVVILLISLLVVWLGVELTH